MNKEHRLRLIGGTASPYTRKMLALLRYRHIPYQMIWQDPKAALDSMEIEKPKPTLLPTFLFKDDDGKDTPVCDSTPIIRRLEANYQGRSVLPEDRALAFIDYLLEDFGDEWCTKFMFHYRWGIEADAENAGTLLPYMFNVSLPEDTHRQVKNWFTERQVARLYVVGSNEQTASLIDASYKRLLSALETHFANHHFLLGARPAAGDFAIYGQLTQLIGFDHTPRQIAHDISPRTVAWVDQMEDQSGLCPSSADWLDLSDNVESLRSILSEIGRVYAPSQIANSLALQAGEKYWETQIDGETWTQPTFPYQGKCLQWTNDFYHSLSSEDRGRVDSVLAGTGCEKMLEKATS